MVVVWVLLVVLVFEIVFPLVVMFMVLLFVGGVYAVGGNGESGSSLTFIL